MLQRSPKRGLLLNIRDTHRLASPQIRARQTNISDMKPIANATFPTPPTKYYVQSGKLNPNTHLVGYT